MAKKNLGFERLGKVVVTVDEVRFHEATNQKADGPPSALDGMFVIHRRKTLAAEPGYYKADGEWVADKSQARKMTADESHDLFVRLTGDFKWCHEVLILPA